MMFWSRLSLQTKCDTVHIIILNGFDSILSSFSEYKQSKVGLSWTLPQLIHSSSEESKELDMHCL